MSSSFRAAALGTLHPKDTSLGRPTALRACSPPGRVPSDDEPRRSPANDVRQQVGTVLRTDAPGLVVRADERDHPARRAVSCLVDPEIDDRVLVVVVDETAYVLAVLQRTSAGVGISVDGDLRIRTPRGQVAVTAAEDIALLSPGEISMASGRLEVRSAEGNVAIERLTYLGRLVHSQVDKIKSYASSWDGVFERLSHTMKSCYRAVAEVDQLRAERLDYRADATMKLHAHDTLMTAEQLVKIDGDQVHLG